MQPAAIVPMWRRTARVSGVLAVAAALTACSGSSPRAVTPSLGSTQGPPGASPPSPGSPLTPTAPVQGLALVWKVSVPRPGPHVGSVAGIAADAAGNVYLADGVTSKVRVYGSGGKLVRTWGTAGTGPGQLDFRIPSPGNPILGGSVDVAANGHVYVTSPGTGRIQEFDRTGRLLTGWGGLGDGPSRFSLLADVMVGPHGDVYAIDDGPSPFAIQRFTAGGSFVRGYGNYARSGLSTPTLADVAPSGEVYLADPGLTGNGGVVHPRMIRFGANGELVGTWGTFGVGPGEFHTPYSVEVDAAGHVLVGDIQGGEVQEFDTNGTPVAALDLSAGGSVSPWSIAVDGSGDLFVLDDNTFTLYRFRLP